MGRYIVKRLLRGLLTVWLITLVVFLLMRVLGNPIDFLAIPQISLADRERMKEVYGFNEPLYIQYLKFNRGIFTGDFGRSIQFGGRDAFDVFLSRLPATLELVGAGLVFAMVLGLVFGVVSATKPNSISDRIIRVLAITGQALPSFWLALLFILLFSVYLGWLPSAGGPDRVGLKGLIMPAVSLGWFFVAANTRLLRSSMLDVLSSDYITMVRAKGMPSRIVIWRHALKNAIIPLITLFGLNFALLTGGALVTESIFSWPGIGQLLVTSVFTRDFSVVQAVIFFAALMIVFVNVLVDLCYAWIDPRIILE